MNGKPPLRVRPFTPAFCLASGQRWTRLRHFKRKEIIMSTNSKKPSHHVYTVRDGGEQGSDFWTKIGVAFAHNDGKGFSVILEAFPVDGRLTIRQPEPKEKTKQ
jgi:hypothetical protein